MIETMPGDQLVNISHIQREFLKIAEVNEWQGYHSPKNIAAAIAVEAGELLAEFQWLTTAQSACLDEQRRTRVGDEIADVIMYVAELSRRLNIDVALALQEKIEKNSQRFGKK